MNWKDIPNIFDKDHLVAVVMPEPKDHLQTLLWQAAHKFGIQAPDDHHEGFVFLYGQRMHGSGNRHDLAADMEVRKSGTKLFVPHWVTKLGSEINQINYGRIEEAYSKGKAHGKNLLHRLATGDMSVLDFEDTRS